MAPRKGWRLPGFGGGVASYDALLAVFAREGARDAFEELVRRHHAAIYRLTVALLRDTAEAEDATQETFLRAYRSLGRYDIGRTFGPWLRGVAVKVCRQRQRQLRRREKHISELAQAYGEATDGGVPEVSQAGRAALDGLARLPDTYRIPLALFYVGQASVKEVAQVLGLSLGATRVRLHRGREKLRQMLSTEADGSGDQ